MSTEKNINVPLSSTGQVAVASFELDLLFGDQAPADAQEQITYATGGLFRHVVNADATVTFTAAPTTTAGQVDTITVSDNAATQEFTLTATTDTATGVELEGVTYSHAAAGSAEATGQAAS